MALCLSDFKGYFQMVNLKMENVAYEYEDFGIQEDKKKKKQNIGPSPVHVKTEEKKTQNILNQLYQTKCS